MTRLFFVFSQKLKTIFKKKILFLLFFVISFLILPAEAMESDATLTSDKIEYDAKSGVIKGTGNVNFQKGTLVVRGDFASYNVKEKYGVIEGKVKAKKDGITLVAEKLEIRADNIMYAIDNVSVDIKDKKILTPYAMYNIQKEEIELPRGGKIIGIDAILTATYLTGALKDEHFTAKGNVHLIHNGKNIEAGADFAEYFQIPRAKVILRQNAWVVEDKNTLKSEEITLYLLENNSSRNKG